MKNLLMVTPSQWLVNEVKKSFLKEYNVKVLNNGIDLNVFKPKVGDFRNKFNIGDKFILVWQWDRKG